MLGEPLTVILSGVVAEPLEQVVTVCFLAVAPVRIPTPPPVVGPRVKPMPLHSAGTPAGVVGSSFASSAMSTQMFCRLASMAA